MKFIQLTGYYPRRHAILIRLDALLVFEENVTNENSHGSTIFVGSTALQVIEEPAQILNIINEASSIPFTKV